MKNKGKKNAVINKTAAAENWCFVCKDGGDLRICDYKQCLKSYHPSCVGKDDSFLESDENWVCVWHTCFNCHRSSSFYCYTCANGVCRRCVSDVDFLKVKGQYGFCSLCLKLALLIEENKDCDSDGEMVDFTDRETYEGLFLEYYEIVKKEEGLESRDIYAAKNQVKVKKKHQCGSGSEEFDEVDEQISNDDDSEQEKKLRTTFKQSRSKRQKFVMQASAKSNEKDFIGWASRSLVEFLTSIGKSTSEKLSQSEVASIVNQYVKENKLFNPEKRRIITCDAQLQSLFKRRTISRYRINDLLESHFAENHNESEDELEYDSEENSAGISSNVCKRQRKLEVEKKIYKKDAKDDVPQSRFASIVVENIKLVYLKRSLLHELLKQPESFEEKVIGCFVRVKSDPHDYRSKTSHQLMQVRGVKKVPVGETSTDITLLLSDMPREIHMSLVSDDDFSEEECKDLRQKVLSGQLEMPTVRYLEEKAKMLHEDITKHWIKKEVALLQNLIDRANEKGWRGQMFEYLEKKKRLQNPLEQLKLVENVPSVIPDTPEPDSDSGDITGDNKNAKGSPKSIIQCNSTNQANGFQDNGKSEGKACDEDRATHLKWKQNKLDSKHPKQTGKDEKDPKKRVINLSSDGENNSGGNKAGDILANENGDDQERKMWCIRGPNGELDKCSPSVLKRWSEGASYANEFKAWREDENENDAVWLKEAISKAFPHK